MFAICVTIRQIWACHGDNIYTPCDTESQISKIVIIVKFSQDCNLAVYGVVVLPPSKKTTEYFGLTTGDYQPCTLLDNLWISDTDSMAASKMLSPSPTGDGSTRGRVVDNPYRTVKLLGRGGFSKLSLCLPEYVFSLLPQAESTKLKILRDRRWPSRNLVSRRRSKGRC